MADTGQCHLCVAKTLLDTYIIKFTIYNCHILHFFTSNVQCVGLVNFLKCVVTEVVLFTIVAFKTLDISQASVATHLRYGGIFSDSIITNFLLILKVE